MNPKVKLIECPRDAMQGIKNWIPTASKIKYIKQLLQCGFDTIDVGSFVSEKAIPQMRDTLEVVQGLNLNTTSSKLLVIVANTRGAETAAQLDEISYIGFPFSISETFQQRNTNSSIEQSLVRLAEIQNLCKRQRKELVVYLSMGFGNPYSDPWHPQLVAQWCERLFVEFDIQTIAPSDTIGVATPELISNLYNHVITALPQVEFGAHLHTTPGTWHEKMDAAWNAGCRRFDGAIKGFGGCPMAVDQLTGNMPTENILDFLNDKKITHHIQSDHFIASLNLATEIFPNH